MRDVLTLWTTIAIFGVLGFQPLGAEIQEVTVYFQQNVCKENCEMLLHKRLIEADGVSRVSINAVGGEATLYWVPGKPFSYRVVKRPLQRVGLGLEDIYVKVRGSIQETNKGLDLVSFGDNTRFRLISPTPEDQSGGQKRASIGLRRLSDGTKEKLLVGSKGNQLVIIQGPLLSPHRSPPNYLIIEGFKFEDTPEEKQDKSNQSISRGSR